MKKSGIALLLTLSLTLCTVLGCFTFPVSAAEGSTSAATVVDYNAAVVGTELQVVINATEAEGYKLYENGTCVAESEYPIIVYAKYDATKTYGFSAVDADGNETAITNIATSAIAKPDKEIYHASNILAGKPFLMADYARKWAHSGDAVKDWNSMTDGKMDTRYSVGSSLDSVIDGIVELGATYTLGELRLYDYEGDSGVRNCGNNLVIEVYTDGKWVQVAKYDKAAMQANYEGSGAGVGCIVVDLFGYNGDAVRIYNSGMTKTADCLSYWEITLSGVLLSSFSGYIYDQSVKSNFEQSSDLFDGLEFVKGPNNTTDWVSGNAPISNINDASVGTVYKANGLVELDVEFDSDYVVVDTLTIKYSQNTGEVKENEVVVHKNSHYVRGENITVSAFFRGEWRVVYTETFDDNYNCEYLNVNLGGVVAEKLRIASNGKTKYLNKDGGVVYENAVGICDVNATGNKFTLPTDLAEKDNIFLGHTFTTTDALLKNGFYAGTLADLTDGDATDRFVPNSNVAVDVTLDFCGVAILNEFAIVYESVARSGVDILIEVTYDGKTCVIVDEDYATGYSTRIFDLGGVLAESVRVYITKGRDESGGSCIGIREITCTGSVGPTHDVESYDNILNNKTFIGGSGATSIHAGNVEGFGYGELTDGIKEYISGNGRFSTASISGNTTLVAMDAIVELDEKYDLGELRLYDFNPNENVYAGVSLQIMVLVRGEWRTLYNLEGVENLYTPYRVDNYLSYDLGGVNATSLRIIARQTTFQKSASFYEIELSASWRGYADEQIEMEEVKQEAAENEYEGSNILLGIPTENVSINWSGINPNHPLSLAFDGIIEPDIVGGTGSKNRYATSGVPNRITDANGNTIGATHAITIDLKNDTQLNVLSVYEWRSGTAITRSNKTSVEVKINGNWVKMFRDVSLSTVKETDRTDFDLGGVVASAIRITFLNDYFAGDSSTGEWPTPTIKEITCTGELSYGDLLDAFESINVSTSGSTEFGLEQVKDQKLEALKAELIMSGASNAEIIAKINEFKSIAAEYENGVTPVTDEYGDFKSANISLAGNVGFNFYGSLDENVEEQFPNATVVVRYNSVYEGVVTSNTEVRNLSDLTTDATGRYIVDFALAAAQMTDTVEIRLVLDGDNCGEHITWSIKDYCEKILNSEEYGDDLKNVVNAMLTYGAYAQSYFNYNTDKLAADISGSLDSVTETAKPTVDGTATGVSMNSWTLTLDSNVTAKIYVKLDGVNPEDIDVKITTPAGAVINVDSLEAVGSRYRVCVTDITSGYLDDNYLVTFTNTTDGTSMTVTSSAMCYVSAVLAMENADPALVNLVTALKLYSNAADTYFGK